MTNPPNKTNGRGVGIFTTRPDGLVEVVMLRNLNVLRGPGGVEQFGVGDIVKMPPSEAEAWCAAGWARSLKKSRT